MAALPESGTLATLALWAVLALVLVNLASLAVAMLRIGRRRRASAIPANAPVSVVRPLRGLEAFYSGFTEKLRRELLSFAERFDLYVTAGSDYHGKNKLVELGDTGWNSDTPIPEGLAGFLKDVRVCIPQDGTVDREDDTE